MKKQKELLARIKKAGRTQGWFLEQMGMSRATLWRKNQANSFKDDELRKIKRLLK